MSEDSVLDHERFDQEARKILLEHYTSKNIYHGTSLLSVVIAIFTATQAYDRITLLVTSCGFALLLGSLVTATCFLTISMLYLGTLVGAVLRVFPTPPLVPTKGLEYTQNYLTLLESGVVVEARSSVRGAFLFLSRKTAWGWLVLGSMLLFLLSIFDRLLFLRPALFVLSVLLPLRGFPQHMIVKRLAGISMVYSLFCFVALISVLVAVWSESISLSCKYRAQRAADKSFLEGRGWLVYGHRLRRWGEHIQALTGLEADRLHSELLDKLCMKDP